jgi:hypothetical protein
MRKYLYLALMLFIGLNNSMANDSTTFVVNGNMYSKVHTTNKQKSEPTQTPYVYQIGGQELPILLSVNGRAYVIRVSQKTGNEYKYYLGEEISRDICKKMGVEYKEKEKK